MKETSTPIESNFEKCLPVEQDDKDSAQKYLDVSIEMFKTQTGKGSRDLVSKVEKYLENFNAKVSNFYWVSNE